MKVLGIIPARYASSRLPGKPLSDIGGQSMIQRVYQRVVQTPLVDRVVVATDDERILQHVQSFGGLARMTSDTHQSGTDRCAEVARELKDYEIIINIQGDEPFINPADVGQVIRLLQQDDGTQIATLGTPINLQEDIFNPNVVKLVKAVNDRALYFSRSAIPYLRNIPAENWLKHATFIKHLGIYGFLRTSLLAVTELPPGNLEKLESLEQLRWLEAGFSIRVGMTDQDSQGIDTEEDLDRARKMVD
ncbi:MAG: 3-deoxy-manno-octulosonate cytidylyltransferase [Saprospiraceae bacterium]|nr:MAG: 3-deoxy-manno-octulosonate cytidylyltransferase [Saprospiraceae bacterium]